MLQKTAPLRSISTMMRLSSKACHGRWQCRWIIPSASRIEKIFLTHVCTYCVERRLMQIKAWGLKKRWIVCSKISWLYSMMSIRPFTMTDKTRLGKERQQGYLRLVARKMVKYLPSSACNNLSGVTFRNTWMNLDYSPTLKAIELSKSKKYTAITHKSSPSWIWWKAELSKKLSCRREVIIRKPSASTPYLRWQRGWKRCIRRRFCIETSSQITFCADLTVLSRLLTSVSQSL